MCENRISTNNSTQFFCCCLRYNNTTMLRNHHTIDAYKNRTKYTKHNTIKIEQSALKSITLNNWIHHFALGYPFYTLQHLGLPFFLVFLHNRTNTISKNVESYTVFVCLRMCIYVCNQIPCRRFRWYCATQKPSLMLVHS